MEQSTLKTEAEALRHCLNFEILTISEIVAWADSEIDKSPHPDIAIIDVAMAGQSNVSDVSQLLKCVPGVEDIPTMIGKIFLTMKSKLILNPDIGNRIVRALYHMAVNDMAPNEEAKSKMYWFYDALDLAEEEILGTVQDVRKQLKEFLDEYSFE